jgi:hypothetical protein
MTNAAVPDLMDSQVRQDLIAQKTPRQLAGLYQWWTTGQIDQRLIRWVRQQIIVEMAALHGYPAAREFLRALIGQ